MASGGTKKSGIAYAGGEAGRVVGAFVLINSFAYIHLNFYSFVA